MTKHSREELFLDAIFYPASVFHTGQQSQRLKLHHKAADRCVGGVAEILLQLFGGKLVAAIGGSHKLTQIFFFFSHAAL